MSTYKEKLDYTEETKNLIKTAITNKGVAVGEGDTFRSYADKIDSIPAARPMGSIKIKTKDVKDWNNFADSIESIDWSDFNKLGVTSMYEMFYNWKGKTLDIANLSTTGVTSMYSMFDSCSNLISLDLSNFDTSKVDTVPYMFQSCAKLKEIKGLNNLNTENITDVRSMFANCQGFTSLNLSNWNTSKFDGFNSMFNSCSNLISLDLSNWDSSNAYSMDYMFSNCSSLTSITWGNNWASNPAIMEFDAHTGYSWDASYSKLPKESVLDLFNKLAVRDNTPVVNVAANIYDVLTPDEIAIAQDKGWTVTRK